MIQELIGTVVAGLTVEGESYAPTYIYGSKWWQNLVSDEVQNTIVYLFEPVQSNDTLVGNLYTESYPLLMLFAERSALDGTPADNLVYTNRMRRLRAKFIKALVDYTNVSEVTNIKTDDVFNVKDVNLCGVGLQFTVKLINPHYPVC